MKMDRLRLAPVLVGLLPYLLSGQGVNPTTIGLFTKPTNMWPTYNGDYSGRRFSELEQINQANIDLLKIEWLFRITGVGPQRGVGNPTIKSTPLMVDGVLYFSIPDHAWAVDARTGEEIWHYSWQDS